MKIEIYTRSMNRRLYNMSNSTLKLPYKRNRCRMTTADGYFYEKIMKSSADVIINVDEDAFITDNNRLQQLLKYFLDNNFVNCGAPDGGVMEIRRHNPLVTNPFFNIINVSKIKKDFKKIDIEQIYSSHKEEYEIYAPTHLLRTKYAYDFYEPYVPFFLWLATNYKTLYLDAQEHEDGYSTKLLDHNGDVFLLHSWYSRLYGKDDFHTQRLNNLYCEAANLNCLSELTVKDNVMQKFEDLESKCFFFSQRVLNYVKRKYL